MVARSAVIAAAGRSNGSSPGWAIFAVSWSAMSAMPSIIWASFISGVSSFCSDRVYEMTSSPQSSNAAMATDQQRQDSEQLKQFGYGQELHRTMSMFSNFAVTFSYISVTTGIFALFALGLG